VSSLEREFLAFAQQPAVGGSRHPQPAIPVRSIEQVTTGSRRRPEFVNRITAGRARRQTGSVSLGKE
jgi:hypothetical protein